MEEEILQIIQTPWCVSLLVVLFAAVGVRAQSAPCAGFGGWYRETYVGIDIMPTGGCSVDWTSSLAFATSLSIGGQHCCGSYGTYIFGAAGIDYDWADGDVGTYAEVSTLAEYEKVHGSDSWHGPAQLAYSWVGTTPMSEYWPEIHLYSEHHNWSGGSITTGAHAIT
ncbi:MAG: hypothetical protein BroJett004_02240 [Planctomycetota bacterium]|nr:MAG: hypothetical protein BroJett004_02240 [Planctomycetota bacterium]